MVSAKTLTHLSSQADEGGSAAPDGAKVRGRMKQDSRRDAGAGSAGDRAQRIGKGTRIVGRVTGDGDLTVEGRIEGELSLKGRLVVAQGGAVTAEHVQVESAVVEGSVEGDLEARDTVQLRPSGSVQGTIHTQRVWLEEGARFTGRIEMEVELPPKLEGR